MQISRMLLGEADGEDLSLTTDELNHHLFIVGGKSPNKPKQLLKNALLSQVRSGSGLIVLQMEANQTKSDLINTVDLCFRSEDFTEVYNKQIDELPQLVESAHFDNKILYIELHKTTLEFQGKLVQSLVQCGELLYSANSVNPLFQNHLMIVADQIDQYMHEDWIHLSLFSRRNYVSLVFATDQIQNLIKDGQILIHQSFYTLLNNIEHKFVFYQFDTEQNEFAKNLFALPDVDAGFSFKGFLTKKIRYKTLFEILTKSQFIYINEHELYVLDLSD